jgi:ubiquinone/menaquinone biosynthesis C-methylase UbiE
VWANHFSEVTGIDPSSKMLDAARDKLPQEKCESVKYVHSPAEELSFLPDSSVDLVAAGAYSIVLSTKYLKIVRYCSSLMPLV